MNTNTETTAACRPYLAFYHANAKCTGCAAKFELHPAHDAVEGYISVLMANQVMGDLDANSPVHPRFDWDNAMAFNLTFADICEFLRVFRGECESIQDGKGLYVRNPECAMRVSLRHMIEPVDGYSLEAYRHDMGTGADTSARIILFSSEALGLCLALEQSMGLIAFGVPNT